MSQLSTSRHFRWSLLAAPVAGVLVLAGCSGSPDSGGRRQHGGSRHHWILDHGRAGERRRRLLRADGRGVHRRDRRRDRGDPLPLRRVQHPGHHAAAGRQRRRHDGPLARHGPGDLGHHPRRGGLPRAPRRGLRGRHPAKAPRASTRSTARSTLSRPRSRPSAWSTTAPAAKRWASRPTPRPSTICSTRAPRRGTAARPSPFSPAQSRSTRACSRMLISATRVYAGRSGLERAARRGRRDLRRQRLGRTCSNDIIELNEGGCFQDGVAGGTFDTITQSVGSRHVADRGRARLRGDLDRRRRRVWTSTCRRSRRQRAGAVHARVGELRLGHQRLGRG